MLISSVSQCIHIASIYTQTKRCIFRCILIILNCMLESHQHQDTLLVDNGLNASASTIPWQIWSYTKCLKPFFICESSLWWSSIAFSLALIVKYFAGFQSISIPALSPSLILFVFIIRPRIISSLACLPCLIQLVLSPSRRFFAYFFPLHPSVAPSISRGLRFVVAEAYEHRLKVGFYITIYVKKKCERHLF